MHKVRAVIDALGQWMPVPALLAAALLPGIATAQPAPDEPVRCATAAPSYRFLRQAEDWQSLRDSVANCPMKKINKARKNKEIKALNKKPNNNKKYKKNQKQK